VKFRTRGFISLLLAWSFLVAVVSGSVLYVTPRGRVANWSGWTMGGLTKHEWSALHINACLLMLTITIVHLVLNWRIFWSYIRKRSVGFHLKWEMATSVLLAVAVVAGTLYEVPPLTATVAWNEWIKDYWEQAAPASPAPHAEEFTLARLAQTAGLTTDEVVTALQEEGLVVEDQSTTIASLAERNEIVPSQIYAVITKRFPDAAVVMPAGRGGGQGTRGGRGMGGGGLGSGSGRGKTASDGQAGEPSAGCAKDDAADDHEPHAPGQGLGQGLGQGQGRGGQGMGMGRGMGGGRGLGRGREFEAESADNATTTP
jgi:hypothetical protein